VLAHGERLFQVPQYTSTQLVMLMEVVEEPYYVIVQRQTDGHRYVVCGGRIYSHKSEAEKMCAPIAAAFDAEVASGKGGAWRPEVKAVDFL